jgi:hypothetical protein
LYRTSLLQPRDILSHLRAFGKCFFKKIVFFFFIFSARSFGAFFVHFAYRVPRFCVENSPAFQDAPEWGALYKKALSVRARRL